MPISEGSMPKLLMPGPEVGAARTPRKPTTKLYPSITNSLVKSIKGRGQHKPKGAFHSDSGMAFKK